MPQQFTDNARALLTSGIGAGDLSLTVEAAKADRFPSGNTTNWATPLNFFKLVLIDSAGNREVIKVGTRSLGSAVMGNILRGQDGTVARGFAVGSAVICAFSAQDAADMTDAIAAQPAAIQAQSYVRATTTGTATAFAIAPTPAITSYVAGQSWWITFHIAPGLNPTLQISGLPSPPNIVRRLQNGTYQNISALPAGPYRITLVSATQALAESVDALIVGTVSQTAGLPTGSIIERGSNANGEYVRWADGTQICTASLSITGTLTWTYPAAFVATPVVYIQTVASSATSLVIGGIETISATSSGLRMFDVSSASVATRVLAVTAGLQAVGRWF